MTKRLTHAQAVVKRARDEIEKRSGKTPEELYAEREKRLADVIALKVPDRVPVLVRFGRFPLRYAGLPQSAMFYNPAAYQESLIRCLVEFDPDAFQGNFQNTSGRALEKIGPKQFAWPGGTLRDDQDDQFLDAEIMKGEEYDLFISSPDDFILRYYLPRAFEALAPLAKLPPVQALVRYSNIVSPTARFTAPEMLQAFEALFKTWQEQGKYDRMNNKFGNIGEVVGIPPFTYRNSALDFGGNVGIPPFDLFASYLRGMRGVMIDMFKRPGKLLTACDKLLEWQLARMTPVDPKKRRTAAGANHFMSEEFLSRKQFDTFVWPTWKKYILATIDLGYTPVPYMEGKSDDRIEHFLELPKGKALIGFEKIDMARAKSILGGHLCIYGGVPSSLLWGGSPQDVEEYCKDIIKVCGKSGGLILSSTTQMDNVKPENIKAMVDAAKKYGRY